MSSQNIQHNRVYAPILIGIVLLLGIFLLKPLYTSYMNKQVKIATIEKTRDEKKKLLDEFIALQKSFASSGVTDMSEKIAKLGQKFDTSSIMSTVMLNEYTKPTALSQPRITISSISVDKGHKLPSGLSMGTVSVAVSASSVDMMIDFITYLTQSSDFAFTIDGITLPIDTSITTNPNTAVSLSISLGVYYYE